MVAARGTARAVVLGLMASAPHSTLGGPDSIDADRLRQHVQFLASDELAGRETGEPGIRKAEKYIAKEFRRLGLQPLPGRNDYFLDFTLYRHAYDSKHTSVVITTAGQQLEGRAGVDFRPFPFSDEGAAESGVVFAGYGITAPEHDYDDYAGIDVTGKIVLVLRHEPGERDPNSSFDGTSSSSHALFSTKATNAQEHGAAGMLLVTDPLNHEVDDDLRIGGSLRLDPPEPRTDRPSDEESDASPFLALRIGQGLAGAMVASLGRPLSEIQQAIDDGSTPAEFPVEGVAARIAVRRSDKPEPVAARDVAAFIEGRDPVLKNEWIVVGAHHDHVGGFQGEGDTVYNGADDNASGTSGVIALAAAFAERAKPPRRSMAFVTFSGEEKGLLGSRAMVSQQLIPVERVVFMLNLDMIGRNPDKRIQVFGDGYARGLREIVESANGNPGLPVEFAGAGYAGNSDHHAFYQEDIPFLFFFTGVHDDYHQLGDHADKLSYDRMESILDMAYGVLDHLADTDDAPGFIHHVDWLGVQVEILGEGEAARAVITGVEQGSRAGTAGLRDGDVLTGFGDASLEDPREVGRHFREIAPGTQVALGIRRGGEQLALPVERAKGGYMGIVPGSVDEDQRKTHGLGDDEGIVLRQVVADGPSGRAGLREGDLLVRISGRPVGTTDLRRTLSQIGAGETVDVMIIRDGERLTLPVTLGERQ